ncbi:penicillin-insensitive murein endopeptidase [Oricola cellulosilytica]|uniref:Penicillin-insensitive murein endopeptidase n=1 Tax=Oricola cellulosilytica TaxID=1429082 RepID=A0A4R0PG24_9HYPH|nr:penicillin-insensitive murein endopeptidase [Oricola cellulosilytica]
MTFRPSAGHKRLRMFVLGAALVAVSAHGARAQTAAKELFGRTPLPTVSAPAAHGFYSKGCVAGAVAMPVDGPTWQAMRLERNRRWGHPDMIALLQKLSREAVQDGWPGLLVGDISQPRGGPMLSGHASHQVGLDADIWLTKMPDRRLTVSERANVSAVSMLKANSLHVDPEIWSPAHGRLIARAASYDEVERIFVHPGIKKAMCDRYGASRANDSWMRKIRPYYGHHYHFHVRIRCPSDSANCRPQNTTPPGNGCDGSLDWWFTSEPWAPKKPEPGAKPPKKREITLAQLPKACSAVLRGAAPADESLVTYDTGYKPDLARASAIPVAAVPATDSRLPVIIPVPSPRPD